MLYTFTKAKCKPAFIRTGTSILVFPVPIESIIVEERLTKLVSVSNLLIKLALNPNLKLEIELLFNKPDISGVIRPRVVPKPVGP